MNLNDRTETYRLIALDMDGTVLNDKKEMDELIKRIIKDVNYPRPKGHGLVTAQS